MLAAVSIDGRCVALERSGVRLAWPWRWNCSWARRRLRRNQAPCVRCSPSSRTEAPRSVPLSSNPHSVAPWKRDSGPRSTSTSNTLDLTDRSGVAVEGRLVDLLQEEGRDDRRSDFGAGAAPGGRAVRGPSSGCALPRRADGCSRMWPRPIFPEPAVLSGLTGCAPPGRWYPADRQRRARPPALRAAGRDRREAPRRFDRATCSGNARRGAECDLLASPSSLWIPPTFLTNSSERSPRCRRTRS